MKIATFVLVGAMVLCAGATLVLAKDGLVQILRQTAAAAGAIHR